MRSLCIAVLALTGCTTEKAVYLPDGRQGHALECSGTAQTWNDCYAKAGEVCKAAGYEVLSKTSDQQSILTASQYSVVGGTVQKRAMVIACK